MAAIADGISAPAGFVVRTMDSERIVAVVPDGWKAGMADFMLEPPDVTPVSPEFGTRMTVSTNCDGACVPKDWAATVESVEFEHLRRAPLEVVSEEALTEPAGRLLVARDSKSGAVHITAVRWRVDSGRYAYCRVRLTGRHRQQQTSFVAACRGLSLP